MYIIKSRCGSFDLFWSTSGWSTEPHYRQQFEDIDSAQLAMQHAPRRLGAELIAKPFIEQEG